MTAALRSAKSPPSGALPTKLMCLAIPGKIESISSRDPLLRMGVSLARSDPAGGAALLQALARVQPARPEAAQALAALGGRGPS